jgi:hypothetical protein
MPYFSCNQAGALSIAVPDGQSSFCSLSLFHNTTSCSKQATLSHSKTFASVRKSLVLTMKTINLQSNNEHFVPDYVEIRTNEALSMIIYFRIL